MNVIRLILGSLFLVACSSSTTPTPSAAATSSGNEEPSCSCSSMSPEERASALELEWQVMMLVAQTVRGSPSDQQAATVFVATASRILGYEDLESACVIAGMLESYSSGCRGGPRTRHDGLLPDLARRADEICTDHEPRASTTLASLRECGLAP